MLFLHIKRDRRDDTEKQDRLREAGTLNRTPERFSDPMFAVGEFFDARDLLQVRYEMVRVVRLGEVTLAQAAARFGVSRPTCFRIVKAFDGGGLQELIPARRGGREGRTRSARRYCASSRTTGPCTDVWERAGWHR